MKTIILVLYFATNAFCQNSLTEWALKFYNSVPPLNRNIIYEADKLIDKKVGKGLCGEFVVEVLRESKVPLEVAKNPKKIYIDTTYWKKLPDNAKIYPGDIIIYYGHIAIIYAKLSPSEYTIIHQNFSGKLKYSHVGFDEIEFVNADEKKEIKNINDWTIYESDGIYRITL